MGYYLNTTAAGRNLPALGKAAMLIKECQAAPTAPLAPSQLPADQALICVVCNGPFDAAALVYDDQEYQEFSREDDRRPKMWLRMDRQKAHELAGYKG